MEFSSRNLMRIKLFQYRHLTPYVYWDIQYADLETCMNYSESHLVE